MGLKIANMIQKWSRKSKSNSYHCDHCNHSVTERKEELTIGLVEILSWMYEIHCSTGKTVLGLTKKQAKAHGHEVPDWIVADRSYSKLAYWAFVTQVKPGVYSLNVSQLTRFFETEKTWARYIFVLPKEGPTGQSMETVTYRSICEDAGATPVLRLLQGIA